MRLQPLCSVCIGEERFNEETPVDVGSHFYDALYTNFYADFHCDLCTVIYIIMIYDVFISNFSVIIS